MMKKTLNPADKMGNYLNAKAEIGRLEHCFDYRPF